MTYRIPNSLKTNFATEPRKQQPVGVVEFSAIEVSVREVSELFDVRLEEIVAFDGTAYFFVLRLDLCGIKTDIFQNLHGSKPGNDSLTPRPTDHSERMDQC